MNATIYEELGFWENIPGSWAVEVLVSTQNPRTVIGVKHESVRGFEEPVVEVAMRPTLRFWVQVLP